MFRSLFKEKERELCVRERLAENKLARAEGLLKNYSLLKEQRFLSLAGGPGTRASSEQSCCPLQLSRVLSCERHAVEWMWFSGGKNSALAVADSLASET